MTGSDKVKHEVKREVKRYARRCFAARSGATTRALPITPINLDALQPDEAQAIADLLPLLICGEESASFLFDDMVRSLMGKIPADLVGALESIAHDELRHSHYLDTLRNALPPPADRLAASRAAAFLRLLDVADPARQLARVAALDSAVCMVLAELLRPATPLSRAGEVATLLGHIHRDEGRHVRITRACIRALGLTIEQETAERALVLTRFADLLLPAAHALQTLQLDIHRMARRWRQPLLAAA